MSPGRRRRGEALMVPPAEFRSYYDRPVVKESPWEADIPAYLFLGGLAAGSSLLAAGADLTGRPALRRSGRLGALVAITASFAALVHDLGRPARFHHMLRVAKVTSPMSVGTWILSLYAPLVGAAAAAEVLGCVAGARGLRPVRLLRAAGRPGGLAAAAVAPAVASYTAVLLADTATPTWHEARHHLPFVFVASAASAAGGLGMVAVPVLDAGPARLLGAGAAVVELALARRMSTSLGVVGEPLHAGRADRYRRVAEAATGLGAASALVGGRRRSIAALAGAGLLVGSWCTRFWIFHAGQQSARDPRYTVVPQRERLAARVSAPR